MCYENPLFQKPLGRKDNVVRKPQKHAIHKALLWQEMLDSGAAKPRGDHQGVAAIESDGGTCSN
jgi:hypothetical protein